MKLVTFSGGDARVHAGALVDSDQRVVDLTATGEPSLASVHDIIEGGDAALEAARAAAGNGGDSLPLEEVTLHAPIPRPLQIRDCLCFEEHFANALATRGAEVPEIYHQQPIYYKANRLACIGTGTDIIWPHYAEMLDYELEFAAWIGTGGTDIAEEDAESHIFGYSVFNDVSARDAQFLEMQGSLGPAKGKDFDTANVLGPCIVTADAVDPHNLTMVARINGEEVSRGSSSTMTWPLSKVIAWISRSETLYAGEMLGSGTVGMGCGLERGTLLEPGDLIELEIEGIGTLRNRIVKPG